MARVFGVGFVSLLMLGGSMAMAAEPARVIRSDRLDVRYEAGRLSLRTRRPARAFVVDAKLRGEGGTARVVPVADPIFGKGEGIEVAYPDGSTDVVALLPGLQFALFRSTLHNGGGEAMVVDRVPCLSAPLDLGRPAEELRALGTGGLTTPAKEPGSYMWLAVADPATRAGVVGGWLTGERGSGVALSGVREGRACLDARVEYGRLRIAPGQSQALETFLLGYFDDARLGLEAWADAVAKQYAIHLPPQPVVYCTWYHAGASNEKDLAAQAAFAQKELAPYGFSVVQIDDGWQEGDSKGNGPRKNFTAYRASGPYPSGMKPTAEGIAARGLTPGLWLMPFAGTYNDPWFADRQQLFARRDDGQPFDTRWGGTCLDMTHPAAQEYVRDVIHRATHEWGYRYLKLDGLWTGSATDLMYVNDTYKDDRIGNGILSDPAKTNVQALRDGLRLVREAAGEGVFLLGCCAPQNMRSYGGAFGLVDAMRIGPDNGPGWGSLTRGPDYGSRNYFLHGRVWYNDPDPLYVRASVPLEHARLICSWITLTGQLNASSDDFAALPPERLDLLRRTMPSHGLHARPVDLFEERIPRVWLLTDDRTAPRRDVVGLFNWEAKPAAFDTPVAHIGLPRAKEYVAFDYWANSLVAPFKERLQVTVPGQACRVLSVRPVLERPQLLSTSRHITQGVVDVTEEKWDGRARVLSGTSKVVGGDPYELRAVTFSSRGLWKAEAAEVSPEDAAAGVTVSLKEEPGLARAVVQSPAGREVHWRIRFAARQEAVPGPGAVADLKAEAAGPFGPVSLTWSGEAPFYEVRQGDTVLAAGAGGTSLTDASVAPGESLRYSVVPISFAGRRGDAAEVAVSLPKPDPGPVPPLPTVSLMTLKPERTRMGWGTFGVGKSAAGLPLRLGKESFADGIGLHADGEALYARRPEWKRFVAVVGIDEAQRPQDQSSLVCEVWADGKLLARSPVLRFGQIERWHFDVALPAGCRKVRLVAADGGDNNKSDHADWVNAGFVE